MSCIKEQEELKKLILEKDIISFDVFDTLLLRNIERPTDIFKLVEKELKATDFYEIRQEAERKSRKQENNYETTFDEIYLNINNYDSKLLNKIKKEELLLENKFLVVNKFMKKIYDFCVANKKKIYIISDMYLPKTFLENKLKECGFNEYDGFFLSCDEKKSKGSGELFDLVKEKENLNVKKWLHIGDNINADVNIPISKGITAYHYKNVFERVKRVSESKRISESILRGIQNNYLLNNETDYWQKFGIIYVSPIYYGFTNWLFRLTNNCDNLFFFSRDGYIIKKVYDMFVKKQKRKIEVHYLYTSRFAYQLPIDTIKDKNKALDTILSRNLAYGQKVCLNDIFSLVELDPEDYKEKLNVLGFSDDYNVPLTNEQFNSIRSFLALIYEDINKKMKSKVNLIKEYLIQEHFNDYKKNYIMDIGWRGSIQRVIQSISKNDIFGFYFGVSNNAFLDIKNNSIGYAMNGDVSHNYGRFIEDNIMMFELLFSSPEGSLIGFEKKNGKVIPILNKTSKIERSIDIFQQSALCIIEEYLKYYEYLNDCIIDDVISDYRDFIKYPEYEDLKAFSALYNNVGFISNEKNYVNVYSKEFINNRFDDFWKKINQSLWRYAFLVEGINNQEDWDKYKLEYEDLINKKFNNKKKINKIKKRIKRLIN